MSTVVMERAVEEAVTDEYLDKMRQAMEACLEINDAVRKHTYMSSDRRRFVCVFEAKDVESVRRSLESVGMDYDSIWTATVF